MTRKKCRRKIWSTAPGFSPVQHAIDGVRVCSDDLLAELRTRELAAIEAFRTGKARLQEWCDLVAMMNVSEHMALNGVGPEAKQTCDEDHGHFIEAAKRYQATMKMGLTGAGLQCMRDLYEFHDLQRTSISRAQYEQFIAATANRIKSKAPEVTDVLEAA